MYDVIASVLTLLKLDKISIDNNVFRLHYKATTFILILFSLLVTQKQYFGDPIDCLTHETTTIDMMDTYCWILSTFTHTKLNNEGHIGVGNPTKELVKDPSVRFHTYYQWVTLMLWLQVSTL